MDENKYDKIRQDWQAQGCPRKFKKGEIVMWSGQAPCIGRIKRVKKLWKEGDGKLNSYASNNYFIDDVHSDLHESNLRLATEEEIKLLGKLNKYILY